MARAVVQAASDDHDRWVMRSVSIVVTLQSTDPAGAVDFETVVVADCRQVRAAWEIVRCRSVRREPTAVPIKAHTKLVPVLVTVAEAAIRLRISRTAAYALVNESSGRTAPEASPSSGSVGRCACRSRV